ncbi:hypothetical protein Q4574_02350 [Aliiglaciecola sp. 3_MG-2023]|uniref:hypothetical protein n=1 Tax=Alteromonadaceae TaxID=72275 RepID=UPI001C083CB3|nr:MULTISPECIES: hypothetical protein [Aliiglaciecola]MBU2878578.1 hypothetical protein [Aliiglaciecola lipolytica]MDO6692103.1 hypothetical protein [Aliiglaciecola sp. 3_MG-2023]MDO6709593.1 hypothetical protein [Aliiglaciecola sp. 2_MG-2023]MDO6750865.1 hypothetical protein [Aliiglaciecola sp. 1_MG-2023]
MKKSVFIFLVCGSIFIFKSGIANDGLQLASQEDLLVAKGEPNSQHEFEDQGDLFVHYYYQTENESYLVDVETGKVCNAYTGKEVRSCFPCAENEVSFKCP